MLFQKKYLFVLFGALTLSTTITNSASQEEDFNKVLQSSFKEDFNEAEGNQYYQKAVNLLQLQNYEGCLAYIDSSLISYRLLKDSTLISKSLLLKGRIFTELKKYDNALLVLKEAELLLRDNHRCKQRNRFYLYMGHFHLGIKDVDKAYYYLKKSIHLAISRKDNEFLGYAKLGLANLYEVKSQLVLSRQQYREILQKEEYSPFKRLRQTARYRLANILIKSSKFKEAKNVALEYVQKEDDTILDPIILSAVHHIRGRASEGLKQQQEAKIHYKKAYEVATQYGLKAEALEASQSFYNLFKANGQHRKALAWLENTLNIKDSIFKVFESVHQIEREQILNQKNEELDQLTQNNQEIKFLYKNRIIAMLCFFVVVLLFWGGWVIRYSLRRAKEKYQIAESKLQALRTQMNPHFIFNVINSIQHYVLHADKLKAYKYLNKFTEALRLILSNSASSLIRLSEELKIVTLYIELQQIRFPGKILPQITVDQNIETQQLQIPAMVLQPLVENAITHGILNKEEVGHLHIKLSKDNDLLQCVIEDDGVGRANTRVSQKFKRRPSITTINTIQRIKLLIKQGFKNAKFDIIDKKSPEGKALGTKIILVLPLLPFGHKPQETFAE